MFISNVLCIFVYYESISVGYLLRVRKIRDCEAVGKIVVEHVEYKYIAD